jgi:hypothetical protein
LDELCLEACRSARLERFRKGGKRIRVVVQRGGPDTLVTCPTSRIRVARSELVKNEYGARQVALLSLDDRPDSRCPELVSVGAQIGIEYFARILIEDLSSEQRTR